MPNPQVELLARRRQNQRFLILLAFGVLVPPLIYGVMYVLVDDDETSPLFWVLLSAIMIVTWLSVIGFILWQRGRDKPWAQPPMLMGVERSRRKSILRAIRAKQPVPEDDHEIAVSTARAMTRQRWTLWFAPFLVLLWSWNALTGEFEVWDVLQIVGAVGLCISVPFALRDIRRARNWLEKYETR